MSRTPQSWRRIAAALVPTLLSCACHSAAPRADLVPTPGDADPRRAGGASISIAAAVEELCDRDVVFIGEVHGDDVAHELILELVSELGARCGGLALSMEMFERDVQDVLDAYVDGRIDEAAFLEQARPWPNYAQHYRPLIELAAERNYELIAANVPRWIKARVSGGGLLAGASLFAAPNVDASDGPYKERYRATMQALGEEEGIHGMDGASLDRFFEAQALSDATMADALVRYLNRPERAPLVVHLSGHFHVDYGQGTVERVVARRPQTTYAIVSMGDHDPALEPRGDFWLRSE